MLENLKQPYTGKFVKGDVKSQEVLLTCLIASTTVTVFPVPGGPNTKYGAGRDDPDKIF